MSLPDWLRQSLANPPQAGAGIHAWLFSTARQLHAHMPAAAVEAALMAATAGATRNVTAREIRDAVANSREVAWQRTPHKAGQVRSGNVPKAGAGRVSVPTAPDLTRWPAVDRQAREGAIRMSRLEGVGNLGALWAQSPCMAVTEGPDDYLDWLFPGAEWLCLATDHPATARSRPPHRWSFGPAEECGLVVPSPMTAPSGKALDGTTSHRCLANTAPRRWLVIEFDSGSIDEQAALHWHLGSAAEAMGWPLLRLAVHSGGKSLHGWYGICEDEARAESLMVYARTLGADTATWNRCQLVRLPAGRRMTEGRKVLQEVWFWDRDGEVWKSEKTLWNHLTLGRNNFMAGSGSPVTAPPASRTAAESMPHARSVRLH